MRKIRKFLIRLKYRLIEKANELKYRSKWNT